jgi:hypothetical protein
LSPVLETVIEPPMAEMTASVASPNTNNSPAVIGTVRSRPSWTGLLAPLTRELLAGEVPSGAVEPRAEGAS